jgi:MASE9
MGSSRLTKPFIGLVSLCGLAILGYAGIQLHPLHHYQFLWLTVMAVLASRLKLKLPGLNGNMSVNLPFILLAAAQLRPSEALAVAAISTFVQCLPQKGHKLQPVQVLFNVSTMAIAAGLGGFVFNHGSQVRAGWLSASALLATAAATFFFANSVPVATVISLSESSKMFRVWSSIFHLSFPYYVASAGITSMVTAASRHVGWQVPLLVLPVMYAIYRSYQLYFGRVVAMTRAVGLVGIDRHSIQRELISLENG